MHSPYGSVHTKKADLADACGNYTNLLKLILIISNLFLNVRTIVSVLGIGAFAELEPRAGVFKRPMEQLRQLEVLEARS